MNILLDYGNSMQKMQVMQGQEVVDTICKPCLQIEDIQVYERMGAHHVILSAVVEVPKAITDYLHAHFHVVTMDACTRVPIVNRYAESGLGTDRLAAAVAANNMFPHQAVLVIQMGTCITVDFVNACGEYMGGSIAPGMRMRLKALHAFSARLPQVEPFEPAMFTGNTTRTSIMAGVYYGIADECRGIIARYREQYGDVKIILSGGDAKMFKNSIKNDIFAFPNIVMYGLNVILNYNVEN